MISNFKEFNANHIKRLTNVLVAAADGFLKDEAFYKSYSKSANKFLNYT